MFTTPQPVFGTAYVFQRDCLSGVNVTRFGVQLETRTPTKMFEALREGNINPL